MTKYRYLITIIVLGITAFVLVNKKQHIDRAAELKQKTTTPQPIIDEENLEIDGKKVVGLIPGQEKKQIKTLQVANRATEDWKESLEEALKVQGGDSVKDINIKKVDSFVWKENDIALFVESVIVTLKNERNEITTFRALVDSETGKILKNWDQPIIDPANHKDNFRIKVDPRYLGE